MLSFSPPPVFFAQIAFGFHRDKLGEAFEGLPEDEPCAEDEVIVDTRDVPTEPEPEQPPLPSYGKTVHGKGVDAPPPYRGGGGDAPPPPEYGSTTIIQVNQVGESDERRLDIWGRMARGSGSVWQECAGSVASCGSHGFY